MNRNIYDTFRGVQTKRAECYDERSAAFITQGKLSKDITHKRLNKDIKAAIVFSHKEGPDEVIVYSFLTDDLQKSDYFIYKNTNYLVYEENRLTDDDINYKKQKAVECNVAFSFNSVIHNGYYRSALRGSDNPDFVGRELVTPDETPLLILPTISNIPVNSEFSIEGKPFKVSEFDNITNKGITYYYLERNYNKDTSLEVIPEDPILLGENDAEADPLQQLSLRAMVEYTFATEDGYFVTSPAVEIISRKRSEIKFRVPFGISQVSIEIKEDALITPRLYMVVL